MKVKKKKYVISATVVGGKFLGEYEANSKDEAIEMATKDEYITLCHQCSQEIEDPQITDVYAEEIEE